MRRPRGGGTISVALGLAPAVQQAVDGGRPAGALLARRRLQVHQVVVGLAHPGLFALVAPPEEELGALLEEAAWREEAGGKNGWQQSLHPFTPEAC